VQSFSRHLITVFFLVLTSVGPHAQFKITAAQRNHWAFQPIKRAEPPSVSADSPIDRFVLGRLRQDGLGFAAPAPKEQLIRRATIDLVGLPPTPAEIGTFVNDPSPLAYEHVIDRLLDSPQYGERWGRHWLDLVRYAETDGFEHDAVRPHSWRYRDYVIQSFNQDKPFDRFIREQLAGDELWPDDPAALTATAFNLLGPDMVDSSDQMQRRHNTLNDMTDTVALTFLGLTVGCARCHDHKFEPISQRDYYSLQAAFTSARFEREHPIPRPEERANYEKALREYNAQPALRELAEFEEPVRRTIFEKKLAMLSAEAQMAHQTPAAERNAEQSNLVLETLEKVNVSESELTAALGAEQKERHNRLLKEVKRVPRPSPLPKSMALLDGKPSPTFVLRRGDYNQPQEEVSAAVPEVLGKERVGRRAELADWIGSPQNPLTARVMVNRIWQHHFGRGLVGTPSDFGVKGEKPSHPELLDWLASEFIRRGWSIKQTHKLIMTSMTFGQSSDASAEAMRVDPENRLYSRMNRIRLEGEVIRDSLLAISARLNLQAGGPGVMPPIPKELFAGVAGWSPTKNEAEMNRRSVYIFARRNLRFPFLEVFDAPDSNLSCPVRESSTTAPQSLTLLNSDEVMAAARATASLISRHIQVPESQIRDAYAKILGRRPSQKEFAISRDFLERFPLSELCRALFNLNDFVYLP
jgi:hypothetical protein